MQAVTMQREVSQKRTSQLLSAVVVVAAVTLLMSAEVYAGGSGMPWESTLDKIVQSLQGPVARTAGIIAVFVTSMAFAFGEGGQMFKRGLAVVFGLSIAFAATTFIGQLGFAGGALL